MLETFFLKDYQELPLYNTGAVLPKKNVLTDYRCWQLHITSHCILLENWITFCFPHCLLMLQSEEPPLSVLHIQYPGWPDQGVPKNTHSVREILKRTYNVPPTLGPIVVHCRLPCVYHLSSSTGVQEAKYPHIPEIFSPVIQCRYWENWNLLHNSQYNPEDSSW